MNLVAHKIQARKANWLPMPLQTVVLEPELPNDQFLKGELIEYYAQQGVGRVRAFSGKEYEFRVGELELLGSKAHRSHLKLGGKVGFDVAQTSHGLRVKKMKVY